MNAEPNTEEIPLIDEGSWVYLSAAIDPSADTQAIRKSIGEACGKSGWPIVSWSSDERMGRGADPGRFFESVRHAVEHADVVVVLIGAGTEMTEAELTLALSHRRPIVGLRISDSSGTPLQAKLREYDRARVVACQDVDECAAGLHAAFSDPEFAETIRLAR
jgi:hypothetical protein